MIIGIDEVGRGPIAGDLVICAAGFSDVTASHRLSAMGCELMDSKAFKSRSRREKAYDQIMSCGGIEWTIARRSPEDIEQVGIHLAVLDSMQEAAASVALASCGLEVARFKFDGRFVPEGMKGYQSEAVIKGDSLISEISMASIIAKVIRDREMCALADEFPHYGFDEHSGYGTAKHIAAIKKHGLIKHHRSWAQKFLEDV